MKLIGIIASIISVLIFLIILPLSFETINSGERGLVVRFGKVTDILTDGFHVVNPFTTDIVTMDVKVQKTEVEASAASKDIQQINAKVAVNFRLDPAKVSEIYQTIRKDYNDKWIAPKLQESVKAATAKYTAEELVTKRELVREEIKSNLVSKLENTGIIVDDANITNFDFSPQFNAAIEAKVTAEQNAKKAENQLKQVEAEAKQAIAKAQAEAESIKLQSAAANNDKFIELKKLEVQIKMAEKWNGVLPVNMYGSAPLPLLPIK